MLKAYQHFQSLFYRFSLFVFRFVDRPFGRHALDCMRCRSRNFQRFLEISVTAHFRILEKNFCILNNFVIFGDDTALCLIDFPKLVYSANDASKCLAYFLIKKWHKFLSSWRRYSKIFRNSRAKLIILTNFLSCKLLRHIDLVDFWQHLQQTGHCRNKFLI